MYFFFFFFGGGGVSDIRKAIQRCGKPNPLVAGSSLNCVFFCGISRAHFMYVHCKNNLESLSQASAFRNKKQNGSITCTIRFRAFQRCKRCIFPKK